MHVCLVSDATISSLQRPLAKALSELGLEPSFTCCEYALHELLDPSCAAYTCGAQATVLSIHADELVPEIFRVRTLLGPVEAREALCERAVRSLTEHVGRLIDGTEGPLLVFDLVAPARSPLGIQDTVVELGLGACIRRINAGLEDALRSLSRASLVTRSCVAARLPAPATSPKMRYLAGQRESRALSEALADELARHLHAILGRTRKVLVLDLDNTLWGGVLGELGLGGIRLDVSGAGRAFRDFQQACLDLHHRGVLLAIASKNDEAPALEALRQHPHAVLRPEHFSAVQIHWEDKAISCTRIAEELNLSLDSLVFFDDNPVEREWVAAALPQVEVVEVPKDPARYVGSLMALRAFETATVSAEDLRRGDLYRQERSRQTLQGQAVSLESYLAELGTRLHIGRLDDFTAPRITQLIQKTNQLNMTTIRRTQSEVEVLAASPDHEVLWASVADRFGDAGVVGVAVVERRAESWRLDTFLLSCRVLKRGVEAALVCAIAELALAEGVQCLEARYVSTRKNMSNRDLFRDLGFAVLTESEEALTCALDLSGPLPAAPHVVRELHPSLTRDAA